MTYESRLSLNYVFGTLTDAASASQTTLTSADFAALPPGLSTAAYVPITLQDPSTKVCEIVWANAHTAGATTVTVVRGKESTTARSWPAGALWTQAPTLRDGVLPVASRAALPTDPHAGLRAYLQDEQIVVEWVLGVGWIGPYAGTYRAVQSLAVDTTSLTFSNIPSTLKRVQVTWAARSAGTGTWDSLLMRVNGSTAGYFSTLSNQGGVTPAYSVEWATAWATVGWIGTTTTAVWNWGAGEIVFPAWNAPGGRAALNWLAQSHFIDGQTNTIRGHIGGEYGAAGPYTSLTFSPNTVGFKAGTEFVLYGFA